MSVRRSLAVFNRQVANHFFGPLMTRFSAFGVVHHRGRKSGREYRTPVKVFRRGDDYVISLPYGATCDWARNVLAAGACELEIRGKRVRLFEPRCTPTGARRTSRGSSASSSGGSESPSSSR